MEICIISHISSLKFFLSELFLSYADIKTFELIRNPFGADLIFGSRTAVELEQYIDVSSDASLENVPYILESNPHPFYSFRGLKNQMRIRIVCGLDSRSRAGFWKNDRAAVRAVRTIQ